MPGHDRRSASDPDTDQSVQEQSSWGLPDLTGGLGNELVAGLIPDVSGLEERATGALDAVAPLLSMCFLMCYACMNLNCFVLDILKDPHWRPKWKYFHWFWGLAGFALCVTVQVRATRESLLPTNPVAFFAGRASESIY